MKRIPPFFVDVETTIPRDAPQWISQQLEYYQDSFTRTERISVAVCTFNVNSKKPGGDLSQWLRLEDSPAIIAVGLQELDMSANALLRGETEAQVPWRESLCALIGADTDSRSISQSYYMLGAKQMVGLYLAVFLHKASILVSRHVRMNVLSTGAMMGALGNKGGIGLRLTIHRSSIIFINAHLAAHVKEVEKRNQDFAAIMAGMLMDNHEPGAPALQPKDHDVVFFFGDLNYRIEKFSYEAALEAIKAKNFPALLEECQLVKEMTRPTTKWAKFREAIPTFAPSYRFDPGTSTYDTSEKKRVPAYTDRVMWWTKELRNSDAAANEHRVILRSISMFPDVMVSDHKPVSALLDVAVSVEVDSDRTKIREELRQQVASVGFDRIIVPKVSASTVHLMFETVTYGSVESQSIVMENKGQCVVQISVHLLRIPPTALPSATANARVKNVDNYKWVSVSPLEQVIFPGDRATFTVDCVMDREAMDFQEATGPFAGAESFQLRQWLVLQPKNGPPHYVEVSARVTPSCFGNTLENLVRLGSRPCVAAYPLAMADAPIITRPRVPKELWCMVDALYQTAGKTPDIFQETGSAEDVAAVRKALDTTGCLGVATQGVVTTALMEFLRDLQQPVIPYPLYHALASATTPKAYAAALAELRPVHYNTFVYVVAFLRYLLRPDNAAGNGVTVEILAGGFGHILMQRPPMDTPHYRDYTPDEARALHGNCVDVMAYYLTTETVVTA